MANAECQARGFDTVLWLLDGKVTEAGASNFFVVWKTSEGKTEMVTAPLDGKIILDGVTRRSILELCRSRLCSRVAGLEKLEVMEREFGMEEIAEAVQEGRIVEAFLAGTAVCGLHLVDFSSMLIKSSTSFPRSHVSTTETKTYQSLW